MQEVAGSSPAGSIRCSSVYELDVDAAGAPAGFGARAAKTEAQVFALCGILLVMEAALLANRP